MPELSGIAHTLYTRRLLGGKATYMAPVLIPRGRHVNQPDSEVTLVIPSGDWSAIRQSIEYLIEAFNRVVSSDYPTPITYRISDLEFVNCFEIAYNNLTRTKDFELEQLSDSVYELKAYKYGAYLLEDKITTVEEALSRKKVLRFYYKTEASSVLYTRRGRVTKLHSWNNEARAFSCSFETQGEVRNRTYRLAKASAMFVEDLSARKLQPQRLVKLSYRNGVLSGRMTDQSFWAPLKQ